MQRMINCVNCVECKDPIYNRIVNRVFKNNSPIITQLPVTVNNH